MNNIFIASIFITGLSGITAQIVLLRELLVSFNGNELTIGIILANWLISEALGAYALGRIIEKSKDKIGVFVGLQLIFCLVLPLSIYFCRAFKGLVGIPFGESVNLSVIFLTSLLIILPISFCHGALFSTACKITSKIGKVYAWETIGTLIGGLLYTYFLIPQFNSFQVIFIVLLLNIVLCLQLFKYAQTKLLKLGLIAALVFVSLFGFYAKDIQIYSINRQWPGQEILASSNSVYGNIVATKSNEQYTFYYNGSPVIVTPYPNMQFVEDFANIPLLFNNSPKTILLLGAGAGGLINEVLKHNVNTIDYAELDPLIIQLLRKFPADLTQKELTDRRVKIINTDSKAFLRKTTTKFDVILLGLSMPSDLSINRLFTKEFFLLVKIHLNQDGIFSFCLPGSFTYLSQELKDLNACILNALGEVYSYIRIIPGDYNIILASNSAKISQLTAAEISQRMDERKITAKNLTPAYFNYRLNDQQLIWFKSSMLNAAGKVNSDFKPFAVFVSTILWNKQFSSGAYGVLKTMQVLDLKILLLLILLITIILFLVKFRSKAKLKVSTAYCIFTTGFFAMLVNLILVFSYQVVYGYLYQMIGLLVSVLMAGIASGSILISANTKRIKSPLKLFFWLEAIILIFSLLLGFVILTINSHAEFAQMVFLLLFFFTGFLTGAEFPLACQIYLVKSNTGIGQASGVLYFFDLIGGWLAGIFGGIIFLPILGLLNTCLVIVFLKISSLFLFLRFKERATIDN
ncbi:MAG: hypothetical protein V1699_01490 [Candidatus Omnitrophota bacterium]